MVLEHFIIERGGYSEGDSHHKSFVVSEKCGEAIQSCKNGRVIAVGTTVTRTLESVFQQKKQMVSMVGQTDIFIREGFEFSVIDGLITNFHLPKSSLLMLVSAISGRERILQIYKQAVEEKYRFFSYGDAMLLLP